jgi:hypothetical protein
MSKDFDYEEFVIECYNDKKDQEIHNASEENALLLFNKLFEKSQKPQNEQHKYHSLHWWLLLRICVGQS